MFIKTLTAAALALFASIAMANVDVNRADQAALETVKGIGPALSGKILAERKTAAFKDWPDLMERVVGVGPKSAARLSEAGLTVNGATFGGTRAADKPAAAPARTTASAGATGEQRR